MVRKPSENHLLTPNPKIQGGWLEREFPNLKKRLKHQNPLKQRLRKPIAGLLSHITLFRDRSKAELAAEGSERGMTSSSSVQALIRLCLVLGLIRQCPLLPAIMISVTTTRLSLRRPTATPHTRLLVCLLLLRKLKPLKTVKLVLILAPGLVSSSVRVERSSFLSDGNANLESLYASESLAIGLWQRVICPIISRNQSTNEFLLLNRCPSRFSFFCQSFQPVPLLVSLYRPLSRISRFNRSQLLHLESGNDLLLVDLRSVHSSGSGLGL
ncbi:hypothetical protein LguiA_035969 [Lonicera macranthoides]